MKPPLVALARMTDETLDFAHRQAILACGRDAIAPLIAVLRDSLEQLNESLDSYDRSEFGGPVGGWAPIHAVELLADMGAVESIPTMLDVLEVSDCFSEIHNRILIRLRDFGDSALEALLAKFAESDDRLARGSIASVLSELTVRDDRVFAALVEHFDEDSFLGPEALALYGDERGVPLLTNAIRKYEIEWENPDPIDTLRMFVRAHEEFTPLPSDLREHFESLDLQCRARANGGPLPN